MSTPHPETPSVTDQTLDGPHGPLGVRVYAPEAPAPARAGLVWAHGGGFAGGDLDMPEADWVAREFARHGIIVVSVDYQRAPLPPVWAAAMGLDAPEGGVHYPVASDEVAFALAWAMSTSGLCDGPWALGGASAGANLAAGAALRLTHAPTSESGTAESGAAETGTAQGAASAVPALVILAYPTLHAVQSAPDGALRAALDADPSADRFGPEAVRGMYDNYLGGSAEDIFAVPGLAAVSDLLAFPPTIMINGEIDELRMSGEAFAATLRAAGVDIDVSTEPGTHHGHLNRPAEPGAAASVARFAERLLALDPPASPTEGSLS